RSPSGVTAGPRIGAGGDGGPERDGGVAVFSALSFFFDPFDLDFPSRAPARETESTGSSPEASLAPDPFPFFPLRLPRAARSMPPEAPLSPANPPAPAPPRERPPPDVAESELSSSPSPGSDLPRRPRLLRLLAERDPPSPSARAELSPPPAPATDRPRPR